MVKKIVNLHKFSRFFPRFIVNFLYFCASKMWLLHDCEQIVIAVHLSFVELPKIMVDFLDRIR